MQRHLRVSADDIGLSRGNTDTILATADHGPLTSVSMLVNGEALEYAAAEYAKRASQLRIALHLNLTEGPALSPKSAIPLLVTPEGMFRHSSFGLWAAYLLSSAKTRIQYRAQVKSEIDAQLARLRSALAGHDLSVHAADGHQHVHMIPFVFDALLAAPDIREIRITREPFYFVPGALSVYFGPHGIGRLVLAALGARNAARARLRGVMVNDYFLGLLFSGQMSTRSIAAGLSAVSAACGENECTTEVLLHPGTAESTELNLWRRSRANLGWHFSPARARERAVLLGPELQKVFTDFIDSTRLPAPKVSGFARLSRFVISGSVSALTTLGLLYALTEWLQIWYVASATIAYAVSILVSFLMQKFWTFADTAATRTSHQFKLFVALQAANAGINALGLYLIVERLHIWYIGGEVIVAGILALWTFLVMRLVIFRPGHI